MTVRANKPSFNVREKLKELERPIGVKGNELMRAETAQDARDFISAGRKNLIINGDFRISQRGDYTSSTGLSGSTYTLDRWKTLRYGGATIQHKTNQLLPNGDISDSALATVTSTGYTGFEQFIEFPEIYSGQTFTISFWIKTNYISTEVNIYNGSSFILGSSNGGTLKETSGEWKYFSRTFTMPSSGNSMFRIEFWTGYGATPAGNYIELAQVQVEKGKVATEFEHRSYGEELALCQRYYIKKSVGYGRLAHFRTNSLMLTMIDLPVVMRDSGSPTISMTNINGWAYADGNGATVSTINASGTGVGGSTLNLMLNVTVNGSAGSQVFYYGGGVVTVDTEL